VGTGSRGTSRDIGQQNLLHRKLTEVQMQLARTEMEYGKMPVNPKRMEQIAKKREVSLQLYDYLGLKEFKHVSELNRYP
jgi:hypothetical protein